LGVAGGGRRARGYRRRWQRLREAGDEAASDSIELAGVGENHREVAAAEAASALKAAAFDPRQASVKVARASILETICDERTAGG
jgi:hypothetical protein